MPEKFKVCRESELSPGQRVIIKAGKRSIGVFNVHGCYFAILNHCPHQHAPLCLGKITGTTRPGAVGEYHWEREGEIIRCPWHGWEFDIKTGRSIFNPHSMRIPSYPVTVERLSEVEEPQVETFPVDVDKAWIWITA